MGTDSDPLLTCDVGYVPVGDFAEQSDVAYRLFCAVLKEFSYVCLR